MAALVTLHMNQTPTFKQSTAYRQFALTSAYRMTACVNGVMNFLLGIQCRSWPTVTYFRVPICTPVKAGSWRLSCAYEILKKETLKGILYAIWKTFPQLTQIPFAHVVLNKITWLSDFCSCNETQSLPPGCQEWSNSTDIRRCMKNKWFKAQW